MTIKELKDYLDKFPDNLMVKKVVIINGEIRYTDIIGGQIFITTDTASVSNNLDLELGVGHPFLCLPV